MSVAEGSTDASGITRVEFLRRGVAAGVAVSAAGVLADGALGAANASHGPGGPTGAGIHPFEIRAPRWKLHELRRRLGATHWPSRELVADRSQGVQLATIQASPSSGPRSTTGARARRG